MKRLDALPPSKVGRPGLHPYHEWVAASPCLLERGVDYQCKDLSLRTVLSAWARDNGYRLTSVMHEDGLAVHLEVAS